MGKSGSGFPKAKQAIASSKMLVGKRQWDGWGSVRSLGRPDFGMYVSKHFMAPSDFRCPTYSMIPYNVRTFFSLGLHGFLVGAQKSHIPPMPGVGVPIQGARLLFNPSPWQQS